MPAENASIINPRTSCLGGWQLGVNTYSKYQNQAKEFIMGPTQAKEHIQYFLGTGEKPTLKAVFNASAIVNSPQGYVHDFLPVFEDSLPRPVSPQYTQMSAKITPIINSYLNGTTTLNSAISQMQSNVQTIINQNSMNNPPPPSSSNNSTTTTTSTMSSSTTPTSSVPTLTTTPGFEFLSILALLTIAYCLLVYKRKMKQS